MTEHSSIAYCSSALEGQQKPVGPVAVLPIGTNALATLLAAKKKPRHCCRGSIRAIIALELRREAVKLYASTPELIAASVFIAVFGFAWWLRSYIGKEGVAALNTRIATLQDGLSIAKDAEQRIAKEAEFLRAHNSKQAQAFEQLNTNAQVQADPELVLELISAIASSTYASSGAITRLSKANTELEQAVNITPKPGTLTVASFPKRPY